MTRSPALLATAALLAAPFVAMVPASAHGLGAHNDHPDATVSEIKDDRITESSGLAVSTKFGDLAYTVNDQGNHPTVYAIRVSTGEIVGTTDISKLDVEDTESIAVDDNGILWLGDLGDNDQNRDNVAIISFPEPGPGDHHMKTADRYPVSYPDGPVDVEGMLVQPDTDRIFLVTKNHGGLGRIYALTDPTPETATEATDLGADAPREVTDATFTHSGRWALLRTHTDVWVYDPRTWKPVRRIPTPPLQQAESVTVEQGDRTMLLGSEGKDSPIVRVALPTQKKHAKPIRLTDGDRLSQVGPIDLALIAGGMIALAVIFVGGYLRRRR